MGELGWTLAELDPHFGWVRPNLAPELGAKFRKQNPAWMFVYVKTNTYYFFCHYYWEYEVLPEAGILNESSPSQNVLRF